MNVGGVLGPGEELASGSRKFVPSLVSSQGIRIEVFENSRGDVIPNNLFNFSSSRPDILKEQVFAEAVLANRFSGKVNINSASKSICNN